MSVVIETLLEREVLLILFGALIGLVGSVAGSVLVARHEDRRQARSKLYRELLVAASSASGRPPDSSDRSSYVYEISAEATVLSVRERRLATKLVSLHRRHLEDWPQHPEHERDKVQQDYEDAFEEAAFELFDHLILKVEPTSHKIARWWRRGPGDWLGTKRLRRGSREDREG